MKLLNSNAPPLSRLTATVTAHWAIIFCHLFRHLCQHQGCCRKKIICILWHNECFVFFSFFSPHTNNSKRKREEVPVNDLKILFFETTDETICRGCKHQFILIFERIKRVLHLASNRKGNGCVVPRGRSRSGQRMCHISFEVWLRNIYLQKT